MRKFLLGISLCFLAAAPAAAAQWQPAAGIDFAIILSVSPKHVVTDAPVVDLDLFDTDQETIDELKGQGKKLICYMSAGSWENWRSDKKDFPEKVKGKPLEDWAGERYLDIRHPAVRRIMKARLDRCKAKGFDAVDPDNVDSFEIGDKTGFPLTKSDAIAYLKFLAVEAHKRGLAIGLKNATEIARNVLDQMDFAVTEDCFDQGWCPDSKNFTVQNKPVFAIEYTDNNIDFDAFCKQAKKYKLSPLLKERNLKTWEKRCP
jgi:uncharacterized protein (TIGR01370 family)